jgi:hypothetical protein
MVRDDLQVKRRGFWLWLKSATEEGSQSSYYPPSQSHGNCSTGVTNGIGRNVAVVPPPDTLRAVVGL